jgi:zinc transport system ATP-binding protein
LTGPKDDKPGSRLIGEVLDNVLEVDRLSVRFGKTEVLKDLSFQIARGSGVAIIGPNGAGKTVLFQALIGSIPSVGTIRWAPGMRIGYVPQKLDLERDVPITGMDFLRARASLTPGSYARIDGILDLVDIPRTVSESMIGTLSGGQFQRLLLGFALLGDPTVLMLDEPTAGIDEPGQRRLNELVGRLREERGLTVIFISHELSVVYQYATSVLCMGRGRACFGPPREILTPDLLQKIYETPVGFHVHDY